MRLTVWIWWLLVKPVVLSIAVIGANGNGLEISNLFLKLLLLLVILLIQFLHLGLEGTHELLYIRLLLHRRYWSLWLEVRYYNIEGVRLQRSYRWWSTSTDDGVSPRHLASSRWVGVFLLLFLKGSYSTLSEGSVALGWTVFSWVGMVIVTQILGWVHYIIFRWYSLVCRSMFSVSWKFNLFLFLFGIVKSRSQGWMISLCRSGRSLINSVRFLFRWGTYRRMIPLGALFNNLLTRALVRFSSGANWWLTCSLLGGNCFHFYTLFANNNQ